MEAGTRVRVEWTDGKVYAGTIQGLVNGYYRVQWEGSESFGWVPPSAIRADGAVPAAPASAMPSTAPSVPRMSASSWGAGAEAVAAPVRPAAPTFDAQAAAARGGKPIMPGIDELPRGLAYEPTGSGAGNGLAFHFFYALSPILSSDWSMRQVELGHLGDDVAALRAAGYRVYVDLLADADRLSAALRDEQPDGARAQTAGVLWAGHGLPAGSLVDWEGAVIKPASLARVSTPPPALRLFVMSACYVGGSVGMWQGVLGPRAKILGWGAPVTAERAAAFLRQDETTSKGFDDLLRLELGAPPVRPEGPLEDAVALGEAITKRMLGHVSTLDRLMELVTTHLATKPARSDKDGTYSVDVPMFLTKKDGTRVTRFQQVVVIPQGDYVLVGTTVGPYSELIDLAKGLRTIMRTGFARVVVTPPKEDGSSLILVQAQLPLRSLRAQALLNVIYGVGSCGDSLEEMYFGADVR